MSVMLLFWLCCCRDVLSWSMPPMAAPMMATTSTPMTPLFGLGAVLMKATGGVSTAPSFGDEDVLVEAADFFTDAFWTAKVGGGARTLTDTQRRSLLNSQSLEFRKRYGKRLGAQRRNELMVARNGRGEIMGVLGIEVDRIPEDRLTSTKICATAPLMSNVAVGRKFRRRGVAEELVIAAENMVRREWGYTECFLYVEKRNAPAVKLYRKLGYRKIWEDDNAKTLIPTKLGGMTNDQTTLVCMRKDLSQGLFKRVLLPFR